MKIAPIDQDAKCVDDPDELEAIADERESEALSLRAKAKRLRMAQRTSLAGSDPWITRVPFEREFAPMKFRRVIDAAKTGKLVMGRVGRAPAVRRSVLEAWIASGVVAAKVVASADDSADSFYDKLAGVGE